MVLVRGAPTTVILRAHAGAMDAQGVMCRPRPQRLPPEAVVAVPLDGHGQSFAEPDLRFVAQLAAGTPVPGCSRSRGTTMDLRCGQVRGSGPAGAAGSGANVTCRGTRSISGLYRQLEAYKILFRRPREVRRPLS